MLRSSTPARLPLFLLGLALVPAMGPSAAENPCVPLLKPATRFVANVYYHAAGAAHDSAPVLTKALGDDAASAGTVSGPGLAGEVRKRLEFVYRHYAEKGVVSTNEIAKLGEIDAKLDPLRTSYISFDDTVTGETAFIIRIYDGFAKPYFPAHPNVSLPATSSAKLPLEIEYPNLQLAAGEDRIEVGRAARDDDSLDDLRAMFAWVDRWIQVTYLDDLTRDPNRDLFIYAECTEKLLPWYVKEHGFRVVAGSTRPASSKFGKDVVEAVEKDFQILPEMKGTRDRFIIRMPRTTLYERNYKVRSDGTIPPKPRGSGRKKANAR